MVGGCWLLIVGCWLLVEGSRGVLVSLGSNVLDTKLRSSSDQSNDSTQLV